MTLDVLIIVIGGLKHDIVWADNFVQTTFFPKKKFSPQKDHPIYKRVIHYRRHGGVRNSSLD